MTKRYYLNGKGGTDSDCTLSTCVYNEQLLETRSDSTDLDGDITVAATWRNYMVWTTPSGEPGITDWAYGQYHGQANVLKYDQGSYRFRMVQVSSSCAWVWGIMVSAGKTGTGIKTWTAMKNPASSSSGDRLQVRLQTYLTIAQASLGQELDIEAGDDTWTQAPLGSEGAIDAEAQSSSVDAAAVARPQTAIDAEAQSSSVDAEATVRRQTTIDAEASSSSVDAAAVARPQAAIDAEASSSQVDAAGTVRRQARINAVAQDSLAELGAQVRRQAAILAAAQEAEAALEGRVRRQAAIDAQAQASLVVAIATGQGIQVVRHDLDFPVFVTRVREVGCRVDLEDATLRVHRARRVPQRVPLEKVIPVRVSPTLPLESEP